MDIIFHSFAGESEGAQAKTPPPPMPEKVDVLITSTKKDLALATLIKGESIPCIECSTALLWLLSEPHPFWGISGPSIWGFPFIVATQTLNSGLVNVVD
jgi:hypothetical protein